MTPTITAQRCNGVADVFCGIDPSMFSSEKTTGRGQPQVTLCYLLADVSSAGRTLIWKSEQQKKRA